MRHFERKLSAALLDAAHYFPALILIGPRQTGKTTLLRHLFPQHSYVSLDLPLVAEQAEADPEAFLAKYPAPVLIDEVQYAPALFRYLKIKIDADRQRKGQYILTGSQKFTLMQGVSESLAGRVAIFDLEGLSCLELEAEQLAANDLDGLSQLIIRGGYPELWLDRNRPIASYFQAYIATNLERDVRQVLAVGNLRDFERFLRACALRSSQQLNKSDLARDVGVSVPTIGEWLSVLEALGHIYFLEPWFGNLNKRLVKSPKLYIAEPALMCVLCNVDAEQLLQSPLIGSIWETLVYAELRKQLAFRGKTAKLWFYRDQSQLEVDFVLEEGHLLDLYECKWTSSPKRSMATNLDRVEQVFLQQAKPNSVVRAKKLVSRAPEDFQSDALRYCSIFHGLIGN